MLATIDAFVRETILIRSLTKYGLLLLSVVIALVILARLLVVKFNLHPPQFLRQLRQIAISGKARFAYQLAIAAGLFVAAFAWKAPTMFRISFLIVAGFLFVWAILAILLGLFKIDFTGYMRRFEGKLRDRSIIPRPILLAVLAVCAFVWSLSISPNAEAERARYVLGAMSRRVTLIELYKPRRGALPQRVRIQEQERLIFFSQLIAESKPLLFFDAVNSYYTCKATVYTTSGAMDLFVAFHPLDEWGIHIKVQGPAHQLTFRNDKIGEMFADALGIEIK